MAMLRVPLGSGKEPEIADEGEHSLTVRRFTMKLSKSGNAMYEVLFAFPGQPDLKPFRQWFSLPTEKDDPERQANRVREIRRFLAAFKIDYDDTAVLPFTDDDTGEPVAFDPEAVVGSTGTAFVSVENDDNDFGDYNRARFARVK